MMGIYKITNKVNGKFYIGSSSEIGRRWNEHIKMLEKKCHHAIRLQCDYDKYGILNFKFEVLEVLNKSEYKHRLKVEQGYLDKYMPYVDTIGYNQSDTAFNKPVNMYEVLSDEELINNHITKEQEIFMKANIQIVKEDSKIYDKYRDKWTLGTNWLTNASDIEFSKIKNDTGNYFKNIVRSNTKTNKCYWTCNSQYVDKLSGDGYKKSWIPNNSHSLKEKRNNLAFLMNVFANDFIVRDMKENNINIDKDRYSLYSLITWIMNVSDITQPIKIYIPSKRMRDMLTKWMIE